MRTPIFAANWKMNKKVSEVVPFVDALSGQTKRLKKNCDIVVGPPATHLVVLAQAALGTSIQLAGQNCGTAKSGAFTAEISPEVLKELGVDWVILGHSERRHIYKEDNALVLSRLRAALAEGLKPILCVGETLEERKADQTLKVVEDQLGVITQLELSPEALAQKVVVAYEPVWAIGTGETATPGQAQEVHAAIRKWLGQLGEAVGAGVRIQYGGSVKPANAAELMAQPDVDGFLVGGASLQADSFFQVIENGLDSCP